MTVPRTRLVALGPEASVSIGTGCLELTARGHSNSGTVVAGAFQIYAENTFISPSNSICLAALTVRFCGLVKGRLISVSCIYIYICCQGNL